MLFILLLLLFQYHELPLSKDTLRAVREQNRISSGARGAGGVQESKAAAVQRGLHVQRAFSGRSQRRVGDGHAESGNRTFSYGNYAI